MSRDGLHKKVEWLLSLADVEIGGLRPWDIRVHDDRFHERVLAEGSLGLGESYMDGWWDCDSLDEFFHRILRIDLERKAKQRLRLVDLLKAKLVNLQRPSRAFEIGKRHYDIGNDLFNAMLDKRLVYTCGYWKDARNLDQAQEAKLDLVCKKIGLGNENNCFIHDHQWRVSKGFHSFLWTLHFLLQVHHLSPFCFV